MMCLKSACPQCLVRAEGVVINQYVGDYEMYVSKLPTVWTDSKQRREE